MSDINERLAFNQAIIDEFRANDGKVSGAFANAPLLLLTTTGAKSGHQRTSPVVYSTDGDRLVIKSRIESLTMNSKEVKAVYDRQ